MPTEAEVLDILRAIQDPERKQDIVSLGLVKNLKVEGGELMFDVELMLPARPEKENIIRECERQLKNLPGVRKVVVNKRIKEPSTGGRPVVDRGPVLPHVKHVIAVASGKGGVGKSTVAANLALALVRKGAATGLLDADIYGPSMPLMFGVQQAPAADEKGQMLPIVAHGVRLMSMGFLSSSDTPVIWRGPMVHGILQQFLTKVEWGELEYLVIDLPPGTGDAQLSLTQNAPITGAVIVTTPQEVSLIDARKGLRMFQKVNVPVLGIIENMSYFDCPDCGHRSHIFRTGGGKKTAEELKVPFLGEIPVDPEVAEAGDSGLPILIKNPHSPAAKAYETFTENVLKQINRVVEKKSGVSSVFKLVWKTVPS